MERRGSARSEKDLAVRTGAAGGKDKDVPRPRHQPAAAGGLLWVNSLEQRSRERAALDHDAVTPDCSPHDVGAMLPVVMSPCIKVRRGAEGVER